MSDLFDLVVAGPAKRAIERLPPKIALAVIDFVSGALRESPHRVGKPLRGDLAGLHSARVGGYRVVYEIDDGRAAVTIIAIDHRADIYRPH